MNTINTINSSKVPAGLQELYDRRKFFGRVIGGSLGTFAVGLGGMGAADHTLAKRKERLKNETLAIKDKSYTTRESITIVGGLIGAGLAVTSPGILSYAILKHEDVDQEVKEAEECLELARADDLRGGHNL